MNMKNLKSALGLSALCGALLVGGSSCVSGPTVLLDKDGKAVIGQDGKPVMVQTSGWDNFKAGTMKTLQTIDSTANTIANSGTVQLLEKGVNIVTGIENANSNRRNANANEDQAKYQKRIGQQLQNLNQNIK
ncbi:MAG: hypothetical protein ACI4RJ_02710 [Alphaproteobacteria bacterium]